MYVNDSVGNRSENFCSRTRWRTDFFSMVLPFFSFMTSVARSIASAGKKFYATDAFLTTGKSSIENPFMKIDLKLYYLYIKSGGQALRMGYIIHHE